MERSISTRLEIYLCPLEVKTMKYIKNKLGIVFIASIFVLSGAGIGYAMWSDTVEIRGTVHTNTLNIGLWEFSCEEWYDPDPHINPGPPYNPGEWEGKDVATPTCGYVGDLFTDPITQLQGYEAAEVTVVNGYPCYRLHMIYRVANLGTTPVIITEIRVTDLTQELLWHAVSDHFGYLYDDKNQNQQYDEGEEIMSFEHVNMIGQQIHSGESKKSETDMHIEQPAEQLHTYHFKIEIIGVQWNEA
jgi:hypothetical protein